MDGGTVREVRAQRLGPDSPADAENRQLQIAQGDIDPVCSRMKRPWRH